MFQQVLLLHHCSEVQIFLHQRKYIFVCFHATGLRICYKSATSGAQQNVKCISVTVLFTFKAFWMHSYFQKSGFSSCTAISGLLTLYLLNESSKVVMSFASTLGKLFVLSKVVKIMRVAWFMVWNIAMWFSPALIFYCASDRIFQLLSIWDLGGSRPSWIFYSITSFWFHTVCSLDS